MINVVNVSKVVYHFAYDETSSELREILKEFEQLCTEKIPVENVMHALRPQMGVPDQSSEGRNMKKTIHLPNCTVVTRLKVV